MFGTLAIREYLVVRDIGKLSPTRHSAKLQTVARSRGLACGTLRRHSATAKQYCSSSSTVARQQSGIDSCTIAPRARIEAYRRAIAREIVQNRWLAHKIVWWRRECQSIPIDVQAAFHSSMWEPTVLATSQWPIRWWLIESLAQPVNFSRRSVIDVMKSHSAVSQGNVTRNKEARCAVIAGAREARFLRLVECVVPRSVALRLPSRGKGRSFEIMSARQFLFVLHDDVPSAQLDRSCDIHIRTGLSRPRFPCSRRQLAGL